MMKIEIFHTAFEEFPRHVATLETALPVQEALELAYVATQNIKSNWTKNREYASVAIQPAAEVVTAKACRSTSMGDYARVVENGNESYWRCCTVGWQQISAADTKLVRQAAFVAALPPNKAS